MAHSFVEFGGKSVQMHDAEIIATVAYVLNFAASHSDRFPPTEYPSLTVWESVLQAHFSGAIDLELDASLATPQAMERFMELMRDARVSLAAEPEVIEANRLNAMIEYGEDFVFFDRPKAKMLADFDRLLSVIDTPL
jgi:hypothetical protein